MSTCVFKIQTVNHHSNLLFRPALKYSVPPILGPVTSVTPPMASARVFFTFSLSKCSPFPVSAMTASMLEPPSFQTLLTPLLELNDALSNLLDAQWKILSMSELMRQDHPDAAHALRQANVEIQSAIRHLQNSAMDAHASLPAGAATTHPTVWQLAMYGCARSSLRLTFFFSEKYL